MFVPASRGENKFRMTRSALNKINKTKDPLNGSFVLLLIGNFIMQMF